MWTTLIAVAGTLFGGVASSLAGGRVARITRAEDRTAQSRAERIQVVTDLAVALANYRAARWNWEMLSLDPAQKSFNPNDHRERLDQTFVAVSAPLTRVCLLLPDLAVLARAAFQAADEIRDASDVDTLKELRGLAVRAEADLVATAAGRLEPVG